MEAYAAARRLLNYTEAAQILGCSRHTIARMVERGELASVRIGPRLVRVRGEDIDALIDDVRTAASDPNANEAPATNGDLAKTSDPGARHEE